MLKQLLNKKMTVQEYALVSDVYGSSRQRWTNKYTDIKCLLTPLVRITRKTGGEETLYGKEQTTFTARVYCDASKITINDYDRLKIDGYYYDIVYTRNIATKNEHYEIDVERIKPDIK